MNNCQNGTFKPVHEIWNFFWPKVFFWSIMKMPIRKNIHNMSQGPPNPGFMQEKVQKGDFLKKPSRELKFFCCFRCLWISRRPGTLNWEGVFFWLSKNLYKQCVYRSDTFNVMLEHWHKKLLDWYYYFKQVCLHYCLPSS